MFLRESYLRSFAQTTEGRSASSQFTKSMKSLARARIFLSHSHKDREIVEGLISLLAYLSEITIYVDWQDASMPRETSRETAKKIKERIEELDLFMILATKNAMESRWVPWEIGVADIKKTYSRILLIPVADPQGNFYGNEYLQLYQSAQISANKNLAVFEPNASRGILFKSWLGLNSLSPVILKSTP